MSHRDDNSKDQMIYGFAYFSPLELRYWHKISPKKQMKVRNMWKDFLYKNLNSKWSSEQKRKSFGFHCCHLCGTPWIVFTCN